MVYVVSGVAYLLTLVALLFTLMPLMSGLYAATPRKGADAIAFAYLFASFSFVITGYGHMRDVLTGIAFDAGYWTKLVAYELSFDWFWLAFSWISFACATALLALYAFVIMPKAFR
jgi:hypothetical protein